MASRPTTKPPTASSCSCSMATRHQKAPTAAGGLGSLPRHLAGPHRVPTVINGRALTIGDLRASRNALTGAAHRLTGIPNRLGRRRARPSDRSNSKAESGNGRNGNEFGHEMKGVWDSSRTPAPSLRSFGAPGVHLVKSKSSPGQKLVRPFLLIPNKCLRPLFSFSCQHANT